jgi:hypothetical protein
MKYCPQCGTQNMDDAQTCTNCGTAFFTPAPAPVPAAVPPPVSSPPPPVSAAPAPVSTPPPQATAAAPASGVGPGQRSFQFTLPSSLAGTTMAVLGTFVLGGLVLLLLILISALSDPVKSDTNATLREITVDLMGVYLLGLALFGGYRLVVYGLDPAWLARMPVWARWMLAVIFGVLLNAVLVAVVNRLTSFLPSYSRGGTVVRIMDFLEGLLVLVALGLAYWRIGAHKPQ